MVQSMAAVALIVCSRGHENQILNHKYQFVGVNPRSKEVMTIVSSDLGA